jgi:hypothetical protein
MRAFQLNMQESRCLKTLHLIGMRFSKEAYGILGEGIATAKTLKRLIINQTNIGSYGLAELAAGFSQCSSIEYLDLQCNDLNDSHALTLSKIISIQFEMRDNLKWKLGLRLPQEIDVSKLGIRYVHLARNAIGSKGAIILAAAIKQDAYLRAVNLKKNKIGENGIKELLSAVNFNPNLLLMDVTDNSSSYVKKGYVTLMKEALLKNLKGTIHGYIVRAGGENRDLKKHQLSNFDFKGPKALKQSRINFSWLNPELFGITLKTRAAGSATRASHLGKDIKLSLKSQFMQFATQAA